VSASGAFIEVAVAGALWALWVVLGAQTCPLARIASKGFEGIALGPDNCALLLLTGIGYALALILRFLGETTVRTARDIYGMQYMETEDDAEPALHHGSWTWASLANGLRAAYPDFPWRSWHRPGTPGDWRRVYDRARDLLYSKGNAGTLAQFNWHYHAKRVIRFSSLPLLLVLSTLGLRAAGIAGADRHTQWAAAILSTGFVYLGWLRLWRLSQPWRAVRPAQERYAVGRELERIDEAWDTQEEPTRPWYPRYEVGLGRSPGTLLVSVLTAIGPALHLVPRWPDWVVLVWLLVGASVAYGLPMLRLLGGNDEGGKPRGVGRCRAWVVGRRWLGWVHSVTRAVAHFEQWTARKRWAWVPAFLTQAPLLALSVAVAYSRDGSLSAAVLGGPGVIALGWVLAYAAMVEHRLNFKWMIDDVAKFVTVWHATEYKEKR
jgi:hypothetical protein